MNFDIPMRLFDGEEDCELVGMLNLHALSDLIDIDDNSLYGDDGLMFIENRRGGKVDNIRKIFVLIFSKAWVLTLLLIHV